MSAVPVQSKKTTLLSLLCGAVLISFSGVWVKISHVSPTASAFYRVFLGGLILVVAALWRHELQWKGIRPLLSCLVCGFFFALDLIFYHRSIHYVGPGLATILPNFQVFILTGIGIVFLGEKVRRTFIMSLPLAFTGLFMIVGVDWAHLGRLYKIGVYCGLAAAVCYAGFLLSLKKLQTEQMGISFFYVLMMVSLSTAALLGIEVYRSGDTFAIPDSQSLWALLALGLFSQAVGWILITNALPQIRASLSGFILLLQPALAFVWDFLFFQRTTTFLNWAGVLVTLAAIYWGTFQPNQEKKATGPGRSLR